MASNDVVDLLDSILTELQASNTGANGARLESELSGIKSELSMIGLIMPDGKLPDSGHLVRIQTKLESISSGLDRIDSSIGRTNELLNELLDRLAQPAAAP